MIRARSTRYTPRAGENGTRPTEAGIGSSRGPDASPRTPGRPMLFTDANGGGSWEVSAAGIVVGHEV
jgi:hypothetical protein